jgi:hypothetical protein
LAVVTTVGGDITSIVPSVHLNFDPDVTNPWYDVAAAADVDVNGYDLHDVGFLEHPASTELTISSGSITPTQGYHTVDTEGDAGTDTLTTITAVAGAHRFLVLREEDVTHNITITNAGNISTPDGNVLLYNGNAVMLFQWTDTTWIVISVAKLGNGFTMTGAIDFDGNDATDVGTLKFNTLLDLTIAAGVIAVTDTYHRVDTEAAAATDDLDSATGGAVGDILIIVPNNDTHTVVVKHAVGADLFFLQNGLDFTMDTNKHTLVCRYNGTQWIEIARSPQTARSLVTTDTEDRCIPYTFTVFIPGVITADNNGVNVYCPYAFTLQNATGYADTAPSGGDMVVDVHDDGVTIFAAGAEKINILDGTSSDTSATKDAAIAAGSYLTFPVSTPNSAADLTIVINGLINFQSAP